MKKIVSFDLDGTLVDAQYGELVWNHGIPTEYSRVHDMPFEDAKHYIRGEYESVGDGDIRWYEIGHWLDRFGLDVPAPVLLDRYEPHIALCPHAREVLEVLGERYTLVIASNAARIFVDKELSHTGLTGFFTRIVSATTDYGLVKKKEEFFQRLCGEMGVSAEDVVHVGDHPVFDHDVPAVLGIESYHVDGRYVRNGAVSLARRTITDLKELLEVLL